MIHLMEIFKVIIKNGISYKVKSQLKNFCQKTGIVSVLALRQ